MKAHVAVLASVLAVGSGSALGAQDWPELYDPLVLRRLELELDPGDWATVVHDETFDIEVPAQFGLAGEPKILVSVRRKSADPLGEKVSLKIDVNELVPGQSWHGVRKLSLENGDDENVIAEGLAWYLHRRAAAVSSSGYTPGLASWIELWVNGASLGVYVNVEQPDKRFLENRFLYLDGVTWLYKAGDLGPPELKVGDPHSPTYDALCYPPFQSGPCTAPSGPALVAELEALIDMPSMLTLGAVSAFHNGPDLIFTKGKNFFFADFLVARRQYLPWDLDSVFNGVADSIYPGGSPPYKVILEQPELAAQYEDVLAELLGSAFQLAELDLFLDALEPVIADAVDADPNNNLSKSAAGEIESLRAFLAARAAAVGAEIGWSGPPSCGAIPYGVALGGANSGTLASTTVPSIGGAAALQLSGVPDGLAVVVLGSAQAHLKLLGGIVLVAPPYFLTLPVAVSGGSGSAVIPIPAVPALAGFTAFAQGAAHDPLKPAGWALTGGLKLTLCP